jgi:hypothetical protein
MLAAALAGAVAVALTPALANAAQTWFTVQLPANIDMTWCEPAGCAGRRPLPPTSVVINNAVTEVVAVPSDPTDPYRHASIVAYGYGSFAATQALYALQSSAAGDTWPGYSELPIAPTQRASYSARRSRGTSALVSVSRSSSLSLLSNAAS